MKKLLILCLLLMGGYTFASNLDNAKWEYEVLNVSLTAGIPVERLYVTIYTPHEMTTDEELKSFSNAILRKEKRYLTSEIKKLTRGRSRSTKLYILYIYNDKNSVKSGDGADYVVDAKRARVFIDIRNYKFGGSK